MQIVILMQRATSFVCHFKCLQTCFNQLSSPLHVYFGVIRCNTEEQLHTKPVDQVCPFFQVDAVDAR